MKNFGIEYNGRFVVVLNGNIIVRSYIRTKNALLKCRSLAADPSNYVELWYQYPDGSCSLLNCWN